MNEMKLNKVDGRYTQNGIGNSRTKYRQNIFVTDTVRLQNDTFCI